MWSWKQSIVLVPSFKTSKLNQTVFNQGKLKSTYKNVPENVFYEFAILCQRYRPLLYNITSPFLWKERLFTIKQSSI